ncbi:MAG: DUF5989 family protein [Candidatus Omnitrophota bacterium]
MQKLLKNLLTGSLGRLKTIRELLGFLWEFKMWWMMPIVIILLLITILIVCTSNTAVVPFVYTLF